MWKFLLTIGALGLAAFAQGQGTIQFGNSVLSPVHGCAGPLPAFSPVVFGVFYGVENSRATSLILAPGLATIGPNAGILVNAPTVFPLPGTDPGQIVSIQIRAWDAIFGEDWRAAQFGGPYYGATGVRQVTLGPPIGPGMVIWQSFNGTSPNRFYPMYVGPLTCIPEPSTWALLGLGAVALGYRLAGSTAIRQVGNLRIAATAAPLKS